MQFVCYAFLDLRLDDSSMRYTRNTCLEVDVIKRISQKQCDLEASMVERLVVFR
jgi:hypothetical protein